MEYFDYVKARVARLREKLAASSLDALVLIDIEGAGWENVFYYSGFNGSAAVVVITADKSVLVTDSRYTTQAGQQSPFEIQPTIAQESPVDTVKRLSAEYKLRRCAFDGAMLSAQTYMALSELPIEWVNYSSEIYSQRRCKDEWEISKIERAADIATAAYLETLSQAHPGMKEIEFSKLLELNIAKHEGQGVWHKGKMIVASGVRSAMPHGVASNKVFEVGDQVTVDYGAIFDAYMSDLTRNFSFGAPRDPEFNEIHEVLLKAHRESAAMLRPGVNGRDVHMKAVQIISDAGYGSYFGHGLGHSFGLEIHENPRLSITSCDVLQVGDIITVEPGVYIPGRGGLRVEDDYLIVPGGSRRLSPNLPQEFVRLDF